MKILIIEDNLSIRNVLRLSLEAESFAVDEAEDGEIGSYMARTNQYDLIILDNVMPKKSGLQVCKELREKEINTPIILLSAKSDINDKVELLKHGADDYLTKPFSFEELKFRIKALLRRPQKMEGDVFKLGPITLNSETQEVKRYAKKIYLTRKEFSMLELFMKNKGKVLTRSNILEHVWDINANPFSNTIESHILNLRKKIGDTHKRIIVNVPGRGYKIQG